MLDRDSHTYVFKPEDDTRERRANLVVVGTIAQHFSDLRPLGSYAYRYNDLLWSKWSFQLMKPNVSVYLEAYDDALDALRLLQQKVSQTGNNRCLLIDTDLGLGPRILFERDLFVDKHTDGIKLKESLPWPVPYRSAKCFVAASERKVFAPLLAYYSDGTAIAPNDLDRKLRGSLVEVHFTLHHRALPSFDCDHFHACISKIVVLQEGQETPRPLRWNEEYRGDDETGDDFPEDVWFPTQVPI
ncbi:hypothetical protein BDN71DRAFT_1509845 [Pleurotus eryngii]|uniref:Uncharacterized protein n=1 Tax=Pleurotus eryngii TaxID=5323 RepID=A0A9P6DE39_PLEER|nr:hypothetical protein BDN71DRAFT_1509845 [Pleurotus eryngii]